MAMGGICFEFVRPERLAATEKFEQASYPDEAVTTIVLTEQGVKTTLTLTVRYESQEARDAGFKTPMEHAVAVGYARLADLLASMLAVNRRQVLPHEGNLILPQIRWGGLKAGHTLGRPKCFQAQKCTDQQEPEHHNFLLCRNNISSA
jgi:hypothetical protein